MASDLDNALTERVRLAYERLVTDYEGHDIAIHHHLCELIPLSPTPMWAMATLDGIAQYFNESSWHGCMDKLTNDNWASLVFMEATEKTDG